jgi:phosphopantothenoylcysteine synthetase/decarboxylase
VEDIFYGGVARKPLSIVGKRSGGIMTAPVLYHVVCAAPPALDAAALVGLAHERGWHVCAVATPHAARWLDLGALEQLTGHPVRSQYKLPHEPDVLPPADAMLVAPATFNTINKWAAGISDTLALGLITEAIGMGLPLVAVPHLNDAQSRHPAFDTSVTVLRDAGVVVMPRQEDHPPAALWQEALDTLRQRLNTGAHRGF